MSIKVRSFKITDYQSVRELWLESGLEIRPGDDLDEIMVKLERDPELFLVAETKGRVVGSVMGAWDGRRGWIYHLGVSPAQQRKGVATRLIREVEARMRKKGVLKVNALIFAWNSASIGFFRHIGYKVEHMMEAQKWLHPRKGKMAVRVRR